jgi:hypothetical protein
VDFESVGIDTELDDSAFYQEPELDYTLNKSGVENKSGGEGHVETDVRSNDGEGDVEDEANAEDDAFAGGSHSHIFREARADGRLETDSSRFMEEVDDDDNASVVTTGSDNFKLPSTSMEPSASTEIVRQVFHQPKGFNIWRDSIQPFINDCMDTGLPEDDKELLHRNGGIHTKGDLARDLRDFLDYHQIRPAAEAHMMSLLEEYFPNANLLAKKTKDGNYKSILKRYALRGFKVF